MDILGLLRRLPEIVAYDKFDDDFFDRLNYSHTVAILTIFAIIVTNRQFSENQIKCWVRHYRKHPMKIDLSFFSSSSLSLGSRSIYWKL